MRRPISCTPYAHAPACRCRWCSCASSTTRAGLLPWDGESTGELQCRGPWVAGGYHNQPTDPEKFTDDGWLRTGDVATIDADGYLRIADRTKDLIKSGGEWISSVDLENAIMGHPAVAEAAVIAVKHPKWDERPLAVVVKKPGKDVTPAGVARTAAGCILPSGRCPTISPSSRHCRALRPANS